MAPGAGLPGWLIDRLADDRGLARPGVGILGAVGSGMARTSQQRDGGWAEQRALRLLQSRGWSLVARNWSCRWGELDLLVAKGNRLLLVEVKGRAQAGLDQAGVAGLDWRKRRRVTRAWTCWLADHPDWQHCSLELVCALVPLPPLRGPVRWLRWS